MRPGLSGLPKKSFQSLPGLPALLAEMAEAVALGVIMGGGDDGVDPGLLRQLQLAQGGLQPIAAMIGAGKNMGVKVQHSASSFLPGRGVLFLFRLLLLLG